MFTISDELLANAEVGFPPRPAEELPPPPETDPLIRAIEEKMNAIEESFDEEVTSNNAPEKSETIPDSKPQPERYFPWMIGVLTWISSSTPCFIWFTVSHI